METNNSLNKKLQDLKSTLPAFVLADHFAIRPDMAKNYTEHQKENFQKDVSWILSFLSESVWAGQPVLFEEFISWLKTFLTSVRVPMKDVAESFELMKKRINQLCTEDERIIITSMFDKAVGIVMSEDQKISLPAMENNLSPLAKNYLERLLKGDRKKAFTMIMDRVTDGTQVRDIYLDVFQPVQYEIGRLWQTSKISVAQEHYCTNATQLVMSQLYPYIFTGEKKNRKMVTTCVPGELHELGARMVTDFLEMNGWDTYYLGANMTIDGVMRFVNDIKPQFLAISATMTYHINSVEEMIRRIKSTSESNPDIKIMVGGYPFKVASGLWKILGADGNAENATEAVKLAETFYAG